MLIFRNHSPIPMTGLCPKRSTGVFVRPSGVILCPAPNPAGQPRSTSSLRERVFVEVLLRRSSRLVTTELSALVLCTVSRITVHLSLNTTAKHTAFPLFIFLLPGRCSCLAPTLSFFAKVLSVPSFGHIHRKHR